VRVFDRSDTSLAVGLVVGAILIFQQPLRGLLEVAHDVEQRYHVDLIPALTVLIGVFIFHEYRKRHQVKAEASAAAAEAAQARARSEELERLMTFGQALANALDHAALQQALWRYLPTFARDREIWLLTKKAEQWESVLHDAHTGSHTIDRLEPLAVQALAQDINIESEGTLVSQDICFPMIAGRAAVGVLGVKNLPALAQEERKALGAAAALVAIAVRNVQLLEETRERGVRDALTGCVNRAYALEALEKELRRAKRSGRPLSILMFDIDHFKTINDQMGHLCGDALLADVGAQLNRVLRTSDVKCRYGGDEFLVILPDTPAVGAEQVAECVRREIAQLVPRSGGGSIAISASLGVAVSVPGDLDPTALIARADEALYEAKRAGRNQFRLAALQPARDGSAA